MRVRDPSSLRLVQEFSKASLRLASEKDNALDIYGQRVQIDGSFLFADSQNQKLKTLDVQTGTLQVVFEEDDPGWLVCNALLPDIHNAAKSVLAVTERNKMATRLVISKKNTNGSYVTDHVVRLDETTEVCLIRLL